MLIFAAVTNAQTALTPYFGVTGSKYLLSSTDKSDRYVESMRKIHSLKIGYRFGFDATHSLSDKVTLRTGFGFQDMGEKVPKTELRPAIFDFDAYKEVYHYQFIHLPIGIQYALTEREKWKSYLNFGGSVNWNVNNYSKIVKYADGKRVGRSKNNYDNDIFQTINCGFELGFGMNYKISEKLFCRFLASGDLLLLPNIKDIQYLYRYYNYGVSVGVGYVLTK
jgi:hypothetical protein